MCKTTSCFMKGMGAGLMAGIMLGVTASCTVKKNKALTKKAGKAIHAMTDIMDNITYMMR